MEDGDEDEAALNISKSSNPGGRMCLRAEKLFLRPQAPGWHVEHQQGRLGSQNTWLNGLAKREERDLRGSFPSSSSPWCWGL